MLTRATVRLCLAASSNRRGGSSSDARRRSWRSTSTGIDGGCGSVRSRSARRRCFSIHARSRSTNAAASLFDPQRGIVTRTVPSASTRMTYRRARGCRANTMPAVVSPRAVDTSDDSALPPRFGRSVPAIDREPALAQAVREEHFHLLRFSIRHGIEMLVQTRDEPLAAPFDDARRFDAVLVILKAL